MSAVTPAAVAAEIIARLDEYVASGVRFVPEPINDLVDDGGAFLIGAISADGTERTFRVEIEEIDT